jgi:hypothetical protein
MKSGLVFDDEIDSLQQNLPAVEVKVRTAGNEHAYGRLTGPSVDPFWLQRMDVVVAASNALEVCRS